MPDAFDQVIATISRAHRVLVTTHVRPDGDALGTTAALVKALRFHGIASTVLLYSKLPTKYAFIYQENGVEHMLLEQNVAPAKKMSEFDCLLVADTGVWTQLPGLREYLGDFAGPKVVLDHHLTQESWADVVLVDRKAAAAAEIAADLLQRWNVPLDPATATALYVGIASDTGWFQFSNTRPQTLRLAAALFEAGVDNDRIYQLLYQNERPQRLLIQARAMQSLEFFAEGRLAVMQVSAGDFAQTGATVNDTESLVNLPLQVRDVHVSILLTQPPEGGDIRVSLRSKGQVDVAKFAEQFKGGGHARAAGVKFSTTLAEAHQRLVDAMILQLAAPRKT